MGQRNLSAPKSAGEAFIVAGWRVDPASLRISDENRTVKLEPKTMAVLDYLACRPGVVVPRPELEQALWAGTVVGYDALSNTIIKLRKAFGDKARSPKIIETIPKAGYRLIAEVGPLTGSGQGSSAAGRGDGERLPRKLAAILYADVADYSRLTREDEDETHRLLKQYLGLFAERIEECNGRVMHYAGDAVLAMFDAAVDAVNCAREVQREVFMHNETLPAGKGLRFRIGINSGDVFEDRGDVYGDGVNIAARLEGLAQPGGICLSEAVRSAVGRKMGIEFQFAGEHLVKNIDDPIRVYTVDAPGAPVQIRDRSPSLPGRPSIVVLPFDNMSGDAEQEYFSDGLSEDITTDLSKLSGLLVIARNSAFAYKGKPVDLAGVSRELGVRYALEGSVRKSGQRVRINAQLIDCTTGGHLWADRYDRDLTDIFSVQDDVTRKIVAAISPSLTGSEQDRLEHRETGSFEAYDYFLKGREQVLLDTEESNLLAHRLLRKAIEIDANFSPAYSYLARCHALAYINNWGDPEQRSMTRALELGREAVKLNPDNPHAHFSTGTAALWLKQHDLAASEVRLSLDIDPNFSEGYGALSMIQVYSGDPESALQSLKTTMRLDPFYRDIYLHLSGQAYFHLGRYPEAVEVLKRRLVRKPDSDISRVLLAASYGRLGEGERGREEWNEALRVNPHYSLAQKRKILPYSNPRDFEQIVDGLRAAGIDVD
ncbi:MAG: adenylate/guanylate cyclase domain-containing protein [Gammaproteobacteria bacterium]|jgi:TolB-like protein/DNA-binding winged helix-turn-helix (wHTH) protein/tetratricopeptide (TPR) repeat protein